MLSKNELALNTDKVTRILNKYQDLIAVQYNYAIEWQELADYILPRKNSILVRRIPGWKRTQRLFDSTAPSDSDKLASSIHSTLTPSFSKWFHLEVEDQELNQVFEVKQWLERTTKLINNALNKSNFNSEAHELFLDLVTFGTGCIYEDEKPEGGWFGGLHFCCVPIGRYVVSENADGRVDTIYRSFTLPLHAVATRWGTDVLPQEVQDKLSEKPNEIYEVIHGVYPTEVKNFQNYKWDSCYILYKTRTILSEKGYISFPYLVPRWTKYSDETYGRGPSHTALPDIRTLNKLVEMELRALAKVVDPPLGVVSGDVIGPARMIPGGITTVRSKEGIFPIQTGYANSYQVSNLTKESLKASIDKMYYIDQLQFSTTGPQMTATESNLRFDMMQRILGPTLGRLEAEFTKPLLNRTFTLMFKAGLFNPIPQILLKGGRPIGLKIQYEGSLARAQRSSDVTALQQFEEIVQPIIQTDPDAADVIDFDAIVRHVAEVLDVPAKVIRDQKQANVIRQQKQQAMEAQQQAQQGQQVAEGAKNVAPLLRVLGERAKPGSVMSKAG